MSLRWGIIGAGRIALGAHLPAIRAAGGSVEAIGSRDAYRADELARESGIPRAHGSYAELVSDPDIDAVYIGLPNGLHEEWCRRAAEAGKDVLCDKALVYTRAEAEKLRTLFRERDLLLAEGFMYRHHPQWSEVFTRLERGDLGDVVTIRAIFVGDSPPEDHRWDRELGRGALFDVGCYAVNVCRYLMRSEPEVIAAHAVMAEPEVDAFTRALLRFPGGVVAEVVGAFRCGFRQSVEIVGSKATLVIEKPFVPGEEPTPLTLYRGAEIVRSEARPANHFEAQIRDFHRSVQAGELQWPAEDGVAQAAVLEAVRGASEVS